MPPSVFNMKIKKNVRLYSQNPYKIAVVHGGPGAPGSVSDIAVNLSGLVGVIEPIQTEQNLRGQIEELKTQILDNADYPVTLIGHSWGAFLSFFLTVNYPELVSKLILLSSGPFDTAYVEEIHKRRIANFTEEESVRFDILLSELQKGTENNDDLMYELGGLVEKSDNYDTYDDKFDDLLSVEGDTFSNVWYEAAKIRSTGKLLSMAELISCPVICIHGDYDPHPYEGVIDPLKERITDFSWYIFENCGHYLWRERAGRKRFYDLLKNILIDQNIYDQDAQKAGE